MKNQSSIFLLFGIIHYEGNHVLGAYSTMAAAESALEAYKAKAEADTVNGTYAAWEFNDYSIDECVLDAAGNPKLFKKIN